MRPLRDRMVVVSERVRRTLKGEGLPTCPEGCHRAVPTHTPSRPSKRAERDTLDTLRVQDFRSRALSNTRTTACGCSRSSYRGHPEVAIADRCPRSSNRDIGVPCFIHSSPLITSPAPSTFFASHRIQEICQFVLFDGFMLQRETGKPFLDSQGDGDWPQTETMSAPQEEKDKGPGER
ncbi:hypothetical protein BJ322DRAFT_658022 [Thelephora terrestris]|uniref:Uncharacterized protein n=1 Tax=Thelephora terrestris TaxID=56493 RepID=A0A9P6L9S1_9AGAM|nr:hypothetical protein BJ322DRAFT_658022 [Thelephora terrestris]